MLTVHEMHTTPSSTNKNGDALVSQNSGECIMKSRSAKTIVNSPSGTTFQPRRWHAATSATAQRDGSRLSQETGMSGVNTTDEHTLTNLWQSEDGCLPRTNHRENLKSHLWHNGYRFTSRCYFLMPKRAQITSNKLNNASNQYWVQKDTINIKESTTQWQNNQNPR
jgi:hypothetical protein